MDGTEQLYGLLKETFLLLDFGDRRLLARFDLTVARYYALYHLAEAPGISLSQLSSRMFCDKSNMTRITKGLEADGYVQRCAHEHDGRVQRLYVTDAGLARVAEVTAAHRVFNEARLSCFNAQQQQTLLLHVAQLRNQLQAGLQAGILADG